MIRVFRRILLFSIIFIALPVTIFLVFQLTVGFSLLFMEEYLDFSSLSAKTWLDANGNGYWDLSEAPLPGVCIWSTHSLSQYNGPRDYCKDNDNFQTNDQGLWGGEEFLIDSIGNDVYIFANTPAGFRATTPSVKHSSYAEFGYAPEAVLPTHQILSQNEYVKEALREYELTSRYTYILELGIYWGFIPLWISLSIYLSGKIEVAWSHFESSQ